MKMKLTLLFIFNHEDGPFSSPIKSIMQNIYCFFILIWQIDILHGLLVLSLIPDALFALRHMLFDSIL